MQREQKQPLEMHAIASTQDIEAVVASCCCDVHGKSSGTAENKYADRQKKPLEVSHDTVTICMMTLQAEEGGVLLCQV